MSIDHTLRRVRAFARQQQWSRNRLATEAGVAESTIRNIFDDDWNPRVETIRQLETVVPPDFEVPDSEAA